MTQVWKSENGEDIHAFNIGCKVEDNDPVYSVHYSSSEVWTQPGSLAMQVVDTGDGYYISDGSNVFNLDYHSAELLMSVLKLLDVTNQRFKR